MSKVGRIHRSGTFLCELDDDPSPMNLWSGLLNPNNGYPPEHAIRAAMLFEAAPEMLEACEEALGALNGAEHALPGYVVAALERAIAKATGEQQ